MRKRDKRHDQAMAELYFKEPSYAIELLKLLLLEGAREELSVLLRQLGIAFNRQQAQPAEILEELDKLVRCKSNR